MALLPWLVLEQLQRLFPAIMIEAEAMMIAIAMTVDEAPADVLIDPDEGLVVTTVSRSSNKLPRLLF
jgi:hypothetical protein